MSAPLRYELLDRYTSLGKGWLSEDGTSTGAAVVVGEPTFAFDLNAGPREVQLTITRNPLDLPLRDHIAPFDLVRVHHPDGRVLGLWKFELASSGYSSDAAAYTLHMTPLGAELTECDFNANHTGDPDPDNQPPKGLATWDIPVRAGVPRTKHCTVGTIQSDGVAYAMVYPRYGKVVDTLNKAIDEGGPDWWWFVGGLGVVELRHGPRQTVALDFFTHVILEKGKNLDVTTLSNVQPVQGGSVAGQQIFGGLAYSTQIPLLSTAIQAAGAYSVDNIGRKVAAVWHDPGVQSQAGVDQLAAQLLARRSVPITTYNLRLLSSAPRLTPGDQVTYTDRHGEQTVGLWVKSVEEEGSTGVQTVALTTFFDVRERPFRANRSSAQGTATSLDGVVVPALGAGGGGGGAACGGMALFFELAGEATPAIVGGAVPMVVTSQAFTVDNTDGAALIAIIDASVNAPAGAGYLELVVAIDSQNSPPARIPLTGTWQNVTRRVTSGVLTAGPHNVQTFLRYTGAAGGTVDVVYDLNVYVV